MSEKYPPLSVVIPTKNERETITDLLSALCSVPAVREIIVVDSSDDGTDDLVARFSRTAPVPVILIRKRAGIAEAIAEGIRAARHSYVCVMDADLQHPPEVITRGAEKLREADVVVFSRYVKGARIDWSPARLVLSKGATILARVLLGAPVADPLSGFFIVKKAVCADVRPVEPKYLLALLVQKRDLRAVEVPYHFRARKEGKSKLGIRDFVLFIGEVLFLMRWR